MRCKQCGYGVTVDVEVPENFQPADPQQASKQLSVPAGGDAHPPEYVTSSAQPPRRARGLDTLPSPLLETIASLLPSESRQLFAVAYPRLQKLSHSKLMLHQDLAC